MAQVNVGMENCAAPNAARNGGPRMSDISKLGQEEPEPYPYDRILRESKRAPKAGKVIVITILGWILYISLILAAFYELCN